jgi:hypothetical protein
MQSSNKPVRHGTGYLRENIQKGSGEVVNRKRKTKKV